MRKLVHRPRRLRRTAALRNLVRETNLSPHDFILPIFVNEKISARRAISSMPGVDQLSPNEIVAEAARVQAAGLEAVLLFGIPAEKDEAASGAYAENGVVQGAVRAIKAECPELIVITDVCLCEYMSHGHCGVTRIDGDHFHVLNDESVELLVKTSLSHAAAGADIVAPSDMMDGTHRCHPRGARRGWLLATGIMSYAAKFASSFYGPFREAAESRRSSATGAAIRWIRPTPLKRSVKWRSTSPKARTSSWSNRRCLISILLWRVRERFGLPDRGYNVSGEYAMVKAAARERLARRKGGVLEIMTGLKRAGADLIVTYWAKELAAWTR